MDHIDKINNVLYYIETHLDQPIQLEKLALKCALSKYHFHRIFRAVVGQRPIHYVEARRLNKAAFDLINTKKRIIEIAFDYGFQSHESFIRAFKKKYGLTPSRFRKNPENFKFQPQPIIGPLNLQLLQGIAVPNPVISQKSCFTIMGLKYTGNDVQQVYHLWQKFWNSDPVKRDRYLGVCIHDMDLRANEIFEYYAGFEIDGPLNTDDSYKTITIPENIYAQFTHRGPINTIEMTFDLIYGNWLPRSTYTPTMDIDILVIDNRFAGMDATSEVEILIPITNKKQKV